MSETERADAAPRSLSRALFLGSVWLFVWLVLALGVPGASELITRLWPARYLLVPFMTLGVLALTLAAVVMTVRLTGLARAGERLPALPRRLAGACGLALGALLAAELALRLSASPPYLYTADPELAVFVRGDYAGTFRTRAFTMRVRTDADGLRNPAPPDATDAARRVLVVGDSFVFGWGVDGDETFVARLARELAPERAAVLGAGMPGTGTAQQTVLLRRFGPSFRPEVVVLAFTLNDFLDNELRAPWYPLRDGVLTVAVPPARAAGPRLWLRHHLRVADTLWQQLDRVRGRRPDIAAQFRAFASLLFADPERLRADPRYTLTLDYLESFVAEVRALGAEPLILLNGDRHIVSDADGARLRAETGIAGAAPDSRLVETLAADLRARGLRVVDSTASLRAAAAGGPVFYPYHVDDHWNERGHAAVARVLAGALREHALGGGP